MRYMCVGVLRCGIVGSGHTVYLKYNIRQETRTVYSLVCETQSVLLCIESSADGCSCLTSTEVDKMNCNLRTYLFEMVPK